VGLALVREVTGGDGDGGDGGDGTSFKNGDTETRREGFAEDFLAIGSRAQPGW